MDEKTIKEIEIDSIESFLNNIHTLPETDYFRGHSSIDFTLVPSIGRIFPLNSKVTEEFERCVFMDFTRKYSLYTENRPKNDFEFLFLAQHYGLPTRLLDWTYNPLVALFFATCSDFDKDGCVFQSFPSEVIDLRDKRWNPFSISSNYSVIPNITDVRYRNQNGLFMIYAKPWEEDLSKITKKFIIPAQYKKGIQSRLQKIGVNNSLIYPSLDSLCKDIKEIFLERYKP